MSILAANCSVMKKKVCYIHPISNITFKKLTQLCQFLQQTVQ